MNNFSKQSTWEPDMEPTPDIFEEDKRHFIEAQIENFARAIVKRGVDYEHPKEIENLISCLYEVLEDTLETFLPEPDCED